MAKYYTNYATGGIVHYTDDNGIGISPMNLIKSAVKTYAQKIKDSHSSRTSGVGSGISATNSSAGNYAGVYRDSANSGATVHSMNDNLTRNISGTMYEDLQNKNNQLALDINKMNNQFNADQAKITRDWEEHMSNTAHQREVKDLQAAGLNPVLSATGGSGASTPSASNASSAGNAQIDTSIIGALTSLATTEMQTQAQINSARIAASASMYGADKSFESSKYSTKANFWSSLFGGLLGLVKPIKSA